MKIGRSKRSCIAFFFNPSLSPFFRDASLANPLHSKCSMSADRVVAMINKSAVSNEPIVLMIADGTFPESDYENAYNAKGVCVRVVNIKCRSNHILFHLNQMYAERQ